MNQGFKLRFDQLRESDPTHAQKSASFTGVEAYAQVGYTRNVCLIWPDGRRMFFNYAYLMAATFEPNAEMNTIQLDFSSHTVHLKGYQLEKLFMALLDHFPRLILATDLRYVLDEDQQGGIVVHIQVEGKTN